MTALRIPSSIRRIPALPASLVIILATTWIGCERTPNQEDRPTAGSGRDVWFEEVAEESGLDFEHVFATKKAHYLPEIMSGGVGLLDFDGDGFLDVYFVQGGELDATKHNPHQNRFYRNLGDGSFEDRTESTGTGDAGYGMGCACGDYDRDGDVDIYVTNLGPNVLYRNDGNGTFTDVTNEAGVGHRGWGSSAAFADYDADGWLDLLVVNYINWSPEREQPCLSPMNERDYCGPSNFGAPAMDTLYHNRGDGTFANATRSAGLDKAFGNGLGVAAGDYNLDGRMDFYVANDAKPNQLWINHGGGRFSDAALLSGCALNQSGAAEAGMGVIATDVDADGDLDLCLSHLRDESHTLYRNDGGLFTDVSATVGLGSTTLPFTGFGMALADFNHDTLLDLLVVNGRVRLSEPAFDADKPYAEPNQLFRGLVGPRFAEVQPMGGVAERLVEASRGAAFGDLDNDGDMDVVVVNYGARAHLLRNVTKPLGNWIMFRVLDRRDSYALGAMVRVRTGPQRQWRQVQRAYSYCSSNDPRVHFGLGAATQVDEVMVRWPGGAEEKFGPYATNQVVELRRGAGNS